MGCKACRNVDSLKHHLLPEILKSIQSDNISNLIFFLKSYLRQSPEPQSTLLNSKLISLNSLQVSLLSYSLISGSIKSFRYLHERCNCSVQLLLENFEDYGLDPLTLVCEKNYYDLLKYFLPIYLKIKATPADEFNSTLEFQTVTLKEPKDTLTPIQIACLTGNIRIVDHLHQYNKLYHHPLLDLTQANEDSGETCALISIRSGSLPVVKLLHKNYNVDFTVKNKFGENALQICAVCSSKSDQNAQGEIFMYLVEEVGIDPRENYEEILLVLEKKELIDYMENVLKTLGIFVSKREVDQILRTNRKVVAERRREKAQEVSAYTESEVLSSIGRASIDSCFNCSNFLD